MMQYTLSHNSRATGFYFDSAIRTLAKERWRSYRNILKGAGLWQFPEAQNEAWQRCRATLNRDLKAVDKGKGLRVDFEAAGNIIWKIGVQRLVASQKAEQKMTGKSAAGDRTGRVALVYGRDGRAKAEADAIIRACGLTVVDFELAQKERSAVGHDYIHEIIEELFSQSAAALVVLTPEEEAVLKPEFRSAKAAEDFETRHQPRANVLLELGMALGRFGRSVIVLEFGSVDLPSDLAGLHRVRWRSSRLAVALEVFRRFKKLGLAVVIPDRESVKVPPGRKRGGK